LPKQRRLDSDEEDQFNGIFKNRPNKKLLQNYIFTTTGKQLTLRDITNHAAKQKPKDLSFPDLIKQLTENTGML